MWNNNALHETKDVQRKGPRKAVLVILPLDPTRSVWRLTALFILPVFYMKASRDVGFFLMSPSQIQIIHTLYTSFFSVNFWKSLDAIV